MNISRGQWLLAFLIAGVAHLALLSVLLLGNAAPRANEAPPRGMMVSLDTFDPGPPARSATEDAPIEAAQPEAAAPVAAPEPAAGASASEPTSDATPQPASRVGPQPAETPAPGVPGAPNAATPQADEAPSPAPQIAQAVTVRPDDVSDTVSPTDRVTAQALGAGNPDADDQPDAASNGAFGSAEEATDDYIVRVRGWLAKHKQYPAAARRDRIQGTVRLYIVIDASGNLISQRIVQSSGSPMLDEAAKQMLARSEPLPRMTKAMRRNRIELVVPVKYSLR